MKTKVPILDASLSDMIDEAKPGLTLGALFKYAR